MLLLLFVGGEGHAWSVDLCREREGTGQFMREGREEIENNDRYIYKFASRPIYSIVIFIFRNLYWTNLAWLTILKCGKSGCREIGTCCPLIRFSQFCLLNGPRMTRNKFYVDLPSDIFALKVSGSEFYLDFYEVDATWSPIRYVVREEVRKNYLLDDKYFRHFNCILIAIFIPIISKFS